MKTAILLSGGIRSACLTWMYRPELAIVIDYGQPASASEIRSASAICAELDITLRVLALRPEEIHGAARIRVDMLERQSDPWSIHSDLVIAAAVAESLRVGAARVLVAGAVREDHALVGIAVAEDDAPQSLEHPGLSAHVLFPAVARSTCELVNASRMPGNLLALTHDCTRSNAPCNDCPGCDRACATLLSIGFDLGYM